MHRSLIPFFIFISSCVPYQQQQTTLYDRILEGSQPGQIFENQVLFENQMNYENARIEAGQLITLYKRLPKVDNLHKDEGIIIHGAHLLIPIEYPSIHDWRGVNSRIPKRDYVLLWDGNFFLDDNLNVSVDLIFTETSGNLNEGHHLDDLGRSIDQDKIFVTKGPYITDSQGRPAKIKSPKGLSYLSFDLTELQDRSRNSVSLNILGLETMTYKY